MAKTTLLMALCITCITSCRVIRPEAVKLESRPFFSTREVSNIDLSVHFDLTNVEQKVDSLVPKEIKSGDSWNTKTISFDIPVEVSVGSFLFGVPVGPSVKVTSVPVQKDIQFKYGIIRKPFSLSAANNSIAIKTDVNYWAEARTRVLAPVYVSCGQREALREFQNIGVSATPTIDNNFNISPNIALLPILSGNQCQLSRFDFDVTDMIKGMVQDMLSAELSKINSVLVEKIDSRARLIDFWNKASESKELTKDLWFNFQPSSFYMSSITGSNKTFTINLGVRAYPSFYYSSSKPTVEKIEPSQLVQNGPITPGFKINTIIKADLNELISEAKRELTGKKIAFDGHSVNIKDIEVYGKNNEAVVAAYIGGSVRGVLYFKGQLDLNDSLNIISVKDFDYDVETANIIVQVANWIMHSSIKNEIEKRLSIDISPQISETKQNINSALNQTNGRVTFTGRLNKLGLKDFHIDFCDEIINTVLVAEGVVDVSIK